MPCRLRLKFAVEVSISTLALHLDSQLDAYPAQALQALEIVLNAPFLRDDRFLYQSRGLYELSQARVWRCRALGMSAICVNTACSAPRLCFVFL